MTTFVINLEKISEETQKLYQQLSSYEEDFDNIINLDIGKIAEEVKDFKKTFILFLQKYVGQTDIYNNEMLVPQRYRYAEITYNNRAVLEKIRLLGVNPENLQRARFFIANEPNPYSMSTLNLVRNIKEINKTPNQRNFEELLSCKRDAWEKDSDLLSGRTTPKYFYSWEQLKEFFDPKPIQDDGQLTEEEIKKIKQELERGGFSGGEANSNSKKVIENSQALEKKEDEKIVKSETAIEWIQRQLTESGEQSGEVINEFLDKFSLGCLIKDALECIRPKEFTCEDILKDLPPGQFFDRISLIFPQGDQTLQAIETKIKDEMLGTETSSKTEEIRDLEKWIEEDKFLMENVSLSSNEKKNLQDAIKEKQETIAQKRKEINETLDRKAAELNLEREQLRKFESGGNISAILSAFEGPNSLTITNAVIAAVDTIVPLENICEALNNAVSINGFEGLASFSFPTPRPLNDPFEGFSFEISEAFIVAITESILGMVQGILNDLVSCDNLDSFIASIVSEDDFDSGIDLNSDSTSEKLKQLFGGGEDLEDIVDRNFDQFVSNFAAMPESRKILERRGPDGIVPIGLDSQGIRETFNPEGEIGFDLEALARATERTALQIAKADTLSSKFQNQLLQSQNNWVIDSTGTKFETEIGTQIFDLEEIDKFLNSITDERIRQLTITPRAIADASGQVQISEAPSKKQEITPNGRVNLSEEDKGNLIAEVKCVLRNISNVLPPSEFLKLLSGNSTEETERIAYETGQICYIPIINSLFPTQKLFINMLLVFGKLSGLHNLEDEVLALADLPQFREENFASACGPYQTVSDFRQELMSRIVEPEQAEEIIGELREKRKQRYNQLVQQVLDSLSGKTPEESMKVNSSLVRALKSALALEEMEEGEQSDEEELAKGEDVKDLVNNAKQNLLSNSTVYNEMFKITIDSIFLPVENIVIQDLKSLGEAFSDLVEVNEPIDREIYVETGNLLFPRVKVINPQFKAKIDSGLVPIIDLEDNSGYAKMVDKSVLATDSILPNFILDGPIGALLDEQQKEEAKFVKFNVDDPTGFYLDSTGSNANRTGTKYKISGDESSKYTRKSLNGAPVPPIENLVNKRVVGAGVKRNLAKYNATSEFSDTNLFYEVKGSLQEVEDKYLDFGQADGSLGQILKSQQPKWTISFQEVVQDRQRFTSYKINSSGKVITTVNGAEDFFIKNFSYTNTIQTKEKSTEYMMIRYSDATKSRKEVFDDIIVENLLPLVRKTENDTRAYNIFAKEFEKSSVAIYNKIVNNFVNSLLSSLNKSRLLETVVNVQNDQSITLLESLDFVECDDVIGIKNVQRDVVDFYRKLADVPTTRAQRRGDEKRPSKIAKSSKLSMTKILLNTIIFDFILKILPVLDYFNFSTDLLSNELFVNIMCEFVNFELLRVDNSTDSDKNRLDYKKFAEDNAKEIFQVLVKQKKIEEITQQERMEHRQGNFNFSLEMKKIVKESIVEISSKCKKVIESVTNDKKQNKKKEVNQDDFLRIILENMKVIDVHDYSTVTEEDVLEPVTQVGPLEIQKAVEAGRAQKDDSRFILEKSILSENGITEELLLQKFVYFPKINRNSQIVQENSEYFTQSRLSVLDNLGIVSIDKAKRTMEKLYRDLKGKEIHLFICEDEPDYENRLFVEPYQVGIRLVSVQKNKDNKEDLILNGKTFPVSQANVAVNKTGVIKENSGTFEVFMVAEERVRINARVEIKEFVVPGTDLGFQNSYYKKLINLLLEDPEVNLILDYAIPLKQIVTTFMLNYCLANNTKKMKYLLEPTKKKIFHISEYLENVGDASLASSRIRNTLEQQKKERDNVGNPAGPINIEAIKFFARTPIQILKSLAIITDPNIALTDKVVSALTIAQQVLPLPEEVKKIPIPYSLTSLTLLPAPIFGGLIPYVPPLTSYNVSFPIAPVFFLAEPFLWDLPFFANKNKQVVTGKDADECKDNNE